MVPIQRIPLPGEPIRDFRLASPDFKGGKFQIQRKYERYYAYFSIQDIFRLFDAEGIDPLQVRSPLWLCSFRRVAVVHTGREVTWVVNGRRKPPLYEFTIVEPCHEANQVSICTTD
jgi:hypothetical protein